MGVIDQALGSSTSVSLASGNVTLTVAQAAYQTVIVTGALGGNTSLILPASVGGRRYVWNQCTGSYTVSVLNGASDTGGGVAVPQGLMTPVILTGTQAYYDNYQSVPPGVIHCYAGLTAPPGFLLCTGASLSTTSYPQLYAAIGYTYGGSGGSFLIPDTRGRILAGADNMGGTAATRLTGYTIATTGGAQGVTLTSSNLPTSGYTVTDPGHNHGVNDAGHFHAPAVGTSFIVTGSGGLSITGATGGQTISNTTASATTGISIQTATTGISVSVPGGDGSHSNIQPTIAINHIIRF